MAWTNTVILDANGAGVAVIPWQSPVWADAAQTRVNVTRDHPVLGSIPFTVDPTDTGAGFDVKQLYDAIVAAGSIGAYVAPA